MKVRKTTKQTVDCGVTHDRAGAVIIAYGDSARTASALRSTIAIINEMKDEFGESFDVKLTFDIDGIGIEGTTL
jgi:hypothetical protein